MGRSMHDEYLGYLNPRKGPRRPTPRHSAARAWRASVYQELNRFRRRAAISLVEAGELEQGEAWGAATLTAKGEATSGGRQEQEIRHHGAQPARLAPQQHGRSRVPPGAGRAPECGQPLARKHARALPLAARPGRG